MARTPFRTPVEDFIVTPGDVVRGEDQAAGGAVIVRGGSSTGGGNPGGDLSLTGGAGNAAGGGGTVLVMGGTAGATGAGGGVTLQGSDAGMGIGGYVFLTGGAGAGGGERGAVRITNTALEFVEAVSVPGGVTAAGRGRVWVRTGPPNVLVFTDGAGTDTTLGGASLTGLPGTIYENLVGYVDSSDRNSYPGSGTTVVDLIGNATNGTLTSVTFEDGAFRFDGLSGDLSFTKGVSLDNVFAGGGTVIAFFRPNTDGENSEARIVDTSDSADEGWWLAAVGDVAGAQQIRFQRNFDGSAGGTWTIDTITDPITGSTVRPVLLGPWSCIAVTYDDSSTANDPLFYLNGFTAAFTENTAPVGTAVSDAGNEFVVGNRTADDRTWDGDVGVVLLFDRILSAVEVQEVFNVFAPRYGLGMRGIDSTTRNAQRVVIAGGISSGTTGGASITDGGDVYVLGGDQTSTSFGRGGDLFIRAGDKTGTGNERGGDIIFRSGSGNLPSQLSLYCGDLNSGNSGSFDTVFVHGMDISGTNTGTPGGVYVRGGNAVSTGSNRGGGDVSIEGGLGDATAGGDVFVRSGGQTSGNTAGITGDITISTQRTALGGMVATGGTDTGTGNITVTTTGAGTGANNCGSITLSTGDYDNNGSVSTNANISLLAGTDSGTTAVHDQGAITIIAGDKNGGGRPGPINLTGGAQLGTGATASVPGGVITISGGNSAMNNATSGGGVVNVLGGDATGAAGPGGAVTITGGDSTHATGTGAGGTVTINAGDATGAGSTGDGGDIILNPGSTVGGAAGEVFVNGKLNVSGGIDPTYLGLNEQVTQPFTALAGIGYLWVRSDAPTTLLYTDDNNEAWILSGVANTSSVRSTTGFVGTESERRTYAVQVTAPSGGGFTTITTLGTLSAAGRNMKFDVRVTGQDSVTSSNFVGTLINQDAWRDTTSTNLATAHASSEQGNGATFLSDIAFSLATSGNDIILRVQNTSSTTTYVINVAVMWTRQQGGLSS